MLKEVRNHHLFVTASAAAILIACFQSGAAQATATPPPADEQTADRIEEIVVTAQKRSEKAQTKEQLRNLALQLRYKF